MFTSLAKLFGMRGSGQASERAVEAGAGVAMVESLEGRRLCSTDAGLLLPAVQESNSTSTGLLLPAVQASRSTSNGLLLPAVSPRDSASIIAILIG